MTETGRSHVPEHSDVVIIGAGFAGMYLLKLMRDNGFNAIALEQGGDVGGTWYWNRYPGARCDVESVQYSHQYIPELEQEWTWSERYASQPEILAYANEIADRLKIRPNICFDRRLVEAHYDETDQEWALTCDTGETVRARFFIMATGCLSVPNQVKFAGMDSFDGPSYQTGQWPHAPVNFDGLRVAVIGTGSSAIQTIPQIARQAAQLTIFQRTANYAVPARNRALNEIELAQTKARYADLRVRQAESFANIAGRPPQGKAAETPLEAQLEEYQLRWNEGGIMFNGAYTDVMRDKNANNIAAEFVRSKIRETVIDPETANLLCPVNTLGAKRLCVDIDYFETYNQRHVHLVDISQDAPSIIPAGVKTGGNVYAVDAIVYATGFDAMTGALLRVNIFGREGRRLRDHWAQGPRTYLGLAIHGFPNLFTVTGPASPSVFTNMIPTIEQHCEWITTCICTLRKRGKFEIEAELDAENAWMEHNRSVGEAHLRSSSSSWYTGENIKGKPVGFMPYIGGFPKYRQKCEEIAFNDYQGFQTD